MVGVVRQGVGDKGMVAEGIDVTATFMHECHRVMRTVVLLIC
jgi:hypothetical protein